MTLATPLQSILRPSRPFAVVSLAFALSALAAESRAGDPAPDFNREIRPILARNCFGCHGQDEASRKGKLRLDLRPDALAASKDHDAAVVPGSPDESPLIARIEEPDDALRMPPKKAADRLSPGRDPPLPSLDHRRRPLQRALGLDHPQAEAPPRHKGPLLAPIRPRPLGPRPPRIRGPASLPRGRPRHPPPTPQPRPPRPPPHPLRDRRLRRRPRPRRLRTRRRPLPRRPRPRRAPRPRLARPRPLRRLRRLRLRPPPHHLALPRLGHRRLQREPPLRPLHRRADRRRPPPERHPLPAPGHRLPPQHDDQHRGRHRRRGIPRRRRQGPRRHHRPGLARPHPRLRQVPQPQVRPRHPRRLLPRLRPLQPDLRRRPPRRNPRPPPPHPRRSSPPRASRSRRRPPESPRRLPRLYLARKRRQVRLHRPPPEKRPQNPRSHQERHPHRPRHGRAPPRQGPADPPPRKRQLPHPRPSRHPRPPSRLPPLARRRQARPPRPRPLARRPQKPPHRPRRREPLLGLIVRRRPRRDRGRLRHPGRTPQPPRASRLARPPLHRPSLGHPRLPPRARHLRHLPPVLQDHPAALEADPRNRFLSRGTRFRLEAETVRDQALALSGLLSRKMHGPSVFPPQPGGLWQAAFNGQRTWTTSPGEDRHRRALYTFWRRTVPYPSMAAFDAPSREICSVRRSRTNTPLQALVTLNDPVYIEAAQALARRIIAEGGPSTESRVRYALKLTLARPPADPQVASLLALYQSEHAHYAHDENAARILATDPLGPLPEHADPAEYAAWTTIANVLLNLDAVLTRN